MNKKYYFILLLLFIVPEIYSQISWFYSVEFNIYNKENEKFTVNNFLDKKIKMYSVGSGAHVNRGLFYNNKSDFFRFSQGTLISRSTIIFEVDEEIMYLNIPAFNLYLNEIIFEPGQFCLKSRNGEEVFDHIKIYENQNPFLTPKYEISYYKCEEEAPKFEDLIEIKLITE